MYKKGKSQKGITLIALVITIIVMLILVGVTISMAVNGGLFDQAGKATGQTKNAMTSEEQLADGGIEINGNTYTTIDEYLIASGNKVETITIYVNDEAFSFPKGLTFGEAINQGKINPGSTRWTWAGVVVYLDDKLVYPVDEEGIIFFDEVYWNQIPDSGDRFETIN